ncbi:MAG: hypothetical protein K6T51_01225 [Rubrobacteraceae bacterium]|nr:hypothetical protein [Rubrobacteraceae bacterium]
MSRLTEKAASRLPLLFVIVPLIAGVAAFLIDETRYLEIARIVVYVLFVLATTVLAVGHFGLIRSARDGRASIWLIAFAYSKLFLAAALWSVAILVSLSLIFGFARSHSLFLSHILYAFIAAAMAGTVLSALVFFIGSRAGCLGRRIWPYPWRRDGRD